MCKCIAFIFTYQSLRGTSNAAIAGRFGLNIICHHNAQVSYAYPWKRDCANPATDVRPRDQRLTTYAHPITQWQYPKHVIKHVRGITSAHSTSKPLQDIFRWRSTVASWRPLSPLPSRRKYIYNNAAPWPVAATI